MTPGPMRIITLALIAMAFFMAGAGGMIWYLEREAWYAHGMMDGD